MTLSFKDVGVKGFKSQDVLNKNKSQLPIGIKTPVELDMSGLGLLKMHTNIGDQVADNLRNLILTNWGERLGNYFFGGNLKPLVVDFSHKDDFDTEAMLRINTAITKWMPFVTPVAYDSYIDRQNNQSTGIDKITLVYSVPSANITNAKLEITLNVI